MAINGNYVLRETTANLTRNITLTVASVLTVFVSLAILGSTVLVRQGAQNATRHGMGLSPFDPGLWAMNGCQETGRVEACQSASTGH